MNGAGIAFSRGDIKLLTEDLMEMKPTIFPTVPRLLNRIYDKVCTEKNIPKLNNSAELKTQYVLIPDHNIENSNILYCFFVYADYGSSLTKHIQESITKYRHCTENQTSSKVHDMMFIHIAEGTLNKPCRHQYLHTDVGMKIGLINWFFFHFSGVVRNDTIWDKLVFSKVQKTLGGRCRVVVTGSAPLAPAILDFVRAAFGCQVSYLCIMFCWVILTTLKHSS